MEDLLGEGVELPSVYLTAGGRLRCLAARGYYQVVDGFLLGVGVIGGVVASGRSAVVHDVADRPDFITAVPGVRAEVCIPLRVQGLVVGAVNAEWRTALPDSAVTTLEAAAELLSARIDALGGPPTPSLSQRLAHACLELATAATPEELERRLVAATLELGGMPTAAVIALRAGRGELRAVSGPLAQRLRSWDQQDFAVLHDMVDAGTSSHFPGGPVLRAEHPFLRAADVRALSVHALRVGVETVGLLVLASAQPAAYSPAVVQCLELLAAQAAALGAVQSALREVSRRADRDELTGLANRSQFAAAVDGVVGRADGNGGIAVLLLDLDDFKHVNDSLGHEMGDRLLCEVAARLVGTLREGDTGCRLGGDEFAMVLPDSDAASAQRAAERILTALAAPVALGDAVLEVSGSIGIALGSPGVEPADQLLRAADLAMYLAKQRGKGQAALFEPGMQRAALDRLALESDLRLAVRSGTLTLAYQPVLDLQTGAVGGVEALVRWQHPVRGQVPPAEFVPVAEQCGLVGELGSWVLRTACRQLCDWDRLDLAPGLTLSVNVSPRQLERPGLVAVLDEQIALGLDPSRLLLGVTETALSVDDPAVLATLTALRSRGVQLVVDDFGTGYSSLNRLRAAPVRGLKLDRSFTAEIDACVGPVPIVDAVLALGRGLGLGVTAGGVETRAQLDYLRAGGCPSAQGFLLAAPVPADELPRLVLDRPWRALLD